MRPPLLASLALLGLALPVQASENWPGWRGPTGMGLCDEAGLPLTWGGPADANLRWKVPIFPADKVRRDQNQSSPIVWGERVFVTASYWPDGAAAKAFPEHHVLCFHRDDGRKLWDAAVAPGPWKLTDLRGGYTAPTPACDGRHVYVAFGSAVVAALDLGGKEVWRKEIVPHDFDVAWAASPVLYEDTVIVTCDELRQKKASFLVAFDGRTGAIRWRQDRPMADWAHSTPLLARVGGRTQLLLAAANGPQGVDPTDGAVLWSFNAPQRLGDTVTPVYHDGLVYVDSGRGGGLGGVGVAVDATGRGDVSATHLKWKIPAPSEGFSSPLVVGALFYRLHAPGVLDCRRWQTGEQVYKSPRLEGIDPAVSPVATADGRIYCASAGRSYVLKAGPTFEVLASSDLSDPSRASPAVAAGRLYLRGAQYLFCVGKK